MEVLAIVIGSVAGVVVAMLLYRLVFRDSDDFWSCVRYSFRPDFISLMKGEYARDIMQSFKLSIWLVLSLLCGLGVWSCAERLFGI